MRFANGWQTQLNKKRNCENKLHQMMLDRGYYYDENNGNYFPINKNEKTEYFSLHNQKSIKIII